MKKCGDCGKKKNKKEFYKRSENSKSLRSKCKDCQKKHTRKNYIARYGNDFDYDEAFLEQNGVCAICGGTCYKINLSIDHCHETGTVRGLLCSNCNAGLGQLGDSESILKRAIIYLRKSKIDI